MPRTGRRDLVRILHAARGLDTALQEFLAHHAIPTKTPSMGSYLYALSKHSRASLSQLPDSDRRQFQKIIVDVRNCYLHKAGAYPANETEVRALLSAMQSCLATVLAL